MERTLEKTYETTIIVIAAVIGVLALVYFFTLDISNANGDSIARLNISRRLFDSTTPGFARLGYVWLPASSITMLPFVWLDALYYTGIAGIIPSLISFLFASYFIYKIGSIVAGRFAGVLAFLFFALNPNVLYMQATPLSETLYLAAVTGAIYYALAWARFQLSRHLMISSALFIIATLSRYDGWIIAGLTLAAIAAYLYLTSRDWKRIEATAVLFASLAFLGPVLWLTWNYVIFGNPVAFAVGEYSARLQQMDLLQSNLLPSYHDAENAAMHVFYAAKRTMGWGLLAAGIMGAGYCIWRIVTRRQLRYLFLFVLGAHVLYYLASLYTGNAVIFVPDLYPHYMHNIRYALTFLPFFAIAAGILASRFPLTGGILTAFVCIEYLTMALSGNVITVQESLHGFAGRDAHETRIQAGQWLEEHYDGGYLLADVFTNDSVAFYSRVPLKNWIDSGDNDRYRAALRNPRDSIDWILIKERDGLYRTFQAGQLLEADYRRVYQSGDMSIYRKRTNVAQL